MSYPVADGKKFERITRVVGVGSDNASGLILDVNNKLWPVEANSKFMLLLTAGSEDTIDAKFEYVMHGKVYRCEGEGKQMSAFVSFGGLLMRLTAAPELLSKIEIDSELFVAIHKYA